MNEEGYVVIVQPFDEHPAANAGLLSGDIILEVDETPIQGMSLYEAISLIRGPADTEVQHSMSSGRLGTLSNGISTAKCRMDRR
jgi:carboxyl-terminal processing protease